MKSKATKVIKIANNEERYFVDGIRNNDSKILNEIYEKYSKAIVHYVTSNSGTIEDAKDVFQEGMIVLFRKVNAEDFELTSNLLTYFYSICKYIWYNKLRKKSITTVEFDNIHEPSDTHSIQKDLERKERSTFYQQKFKTLGEGCQTILTYFYEGFKMKEIAEKMGFASANYATKRKHKCKEQLMNLITKDKYYNEIDL
jgi:RNA polymerase sigma factor (sigma-70 family)